MVVGEGALEEVDASGWVGGGRSGDQGRGVRYEFPDFCGLWLLNASHITL